MPLLANLGAVQLNYGFGLEEARRAVEVLEADGLILHFNPLQEAVQPEGDTNFSGLQEKIAKVAAGLQQPVLLKEVGAGLSPQDIESGIAAGIKWFDLAGRGGTSWSRIEHHRSERSDDDLGLCFQDWGLSTPQALKLAQPYQNSAAFIASGGLRDGIDMVKSVILGASLCGMAAPFLKPAMDSADSVVRVIEQRRREFTTAMFLLGMPDVNSLFMNRALILGER